MKKLLLLSVALCCVFAAAAQKKGYTGGLWYQATPFSLNNKSEFKAVELAVAPGYAFNDKFFVRLQAEVTTGLFDYKDGKTYETTGTIGPSLGYNIIRSEWSVVEAAVTVGNTITKADWRYIYYDFGVKWAFPSKHTMKMFIGVGVRYYDSHNSKFDSFCNMNVSAGFRFN